MPLAADVSLETLAEATHGYSGADLRSLCQEAAMWTLRQRLDALGAQAAVVADDDGSDVTVSGASFREAMKGIRPAALRDRYTQIAPVGWEDIGGLEEAKRTLREAVLWPLEYPEVYRQVGAAAVRGILLSGAPGTGKTLLAGALANEAGINFIYVKG